MNPHRGAAGAGAVATRTPVPTPPALPAKRGFRGRIWVAGSGGWEEVTCLQESRLLLASRSRPAAVAARAAAVSRVLGGDAPRLAS